MTEQLIQRIISGDKKAEIELLNIYERGIKLLLWRRIANPSDREDLFQEIILILLVSIRKNKIKLHDKLNSYIIGIIRNTVAVYIREKTKAQIVDQDELLETLKLPPEQISNLEKNENRKHVKQVLSQMPSIRDRQILNLFYIQELDKQEICDSLKISTVHFNRVIYRAKKRFKREFTRKHADI